MQNRYRSRALLAAVLTLAALTLGAVSPPAVAAPDEVLAAVDIQKRQTTAPGFVASIAPKAFVGTAHGVQFNMASPASQSAGYAVYVHVHSSACVHLASAPPGGGEPQPAVNSKLIVEGASRGAGYHPRL